MKKEVSKAQRLRKRKIWLISGGVGLFLLALGVVLWLILRPIPIETIRFDAENLILKVGESSELFYTYTPENATERMVSFQSSDPAVARVENGMLHALAEGSCYVSITAESGESGYIPVVVEAPLVEKENLLPGEWYLYARKEKNEPLRYVYNEPGTLILLENRTGSLELKKESIQFTDWRHAETMEGYERFSAVRDKSKSYTFYYSTDPNSAYRGSLMIELPSGELLMFYKVPVKE